MKQLALSFFMVFTACLIHAQEEAITLETSSGNLQGTLLLPEIEKPPVVLIIAGSGPTDRNGNNPSLKSNYLKMLAEGLHKNNIASLRFDKRGVAESASAFQGGEIELRFETYINDVEQWISVLKNDARFSSVIILGHSEGSLMGMIAAQKGMAEKYISMAGPGVTIQTTLRRQLADQPPYILSMSLPIIEELEKGNIVDSVPPLINALFRPSIQPYLISWFKYDPAIEITKVKCPILIIQGTTDIQIQVKDAEILTAANPNSQLVVIEGMSHILKEGSKNRLLNIQTYGNPELQLKEGLIEAVASFILN